MGTISKRQRKNGTVAYTGQIVIKRGGKRVHTEAYTSERKGAVVSWMRQREGELATPGGLERAMTPASTVTLGEAINKLLTDSKQPMGRTKRSVLERLKTYTLAGMECGAIKPEDIVSMAADILSRGVKPATVGRELAHLQGVYKIAKPAWGYPLDPLVMREAMVACRMLGYVAEGDERERRPTLDELDKLMTFFQERSRRDPTCAPMHKIIAFAMFSTRRQDEICRLMVADLDRGGPRVMVRDMKHPGQKVGNDVWVDLPEPCLGIIDAIPRKGDRLFPYTASAVSAAFTRACAMLEIKDLHFHDLRHEGISRLFEMGWSIPQVAAVSGHRSWDSLRRYTQIRQTGDKFAGWKWLPVVKASWAPRVVQAG